MLDLGRGSRLLGRAPRWQRVVLWWLVARGWPLLKSGYLKGLGLLWMVGLLAGLQAGLKPSSHSWLQDGQGRSRLPGLPCRSQSRRCSCWLHPGCSQLRGGAMCRLGRGGKRCAPRLLLG